MESNVYKQLLKSLREENKWHRLNWDNVSLSADYKTGFIKGIEHCVDIITKIKDLDKGWANEKSWGYPRRNWKRKDWYSYKVWCLG